MEYNQAYSELWHSQNSVFEHFQGYLGIFRDADAYAVTLIGVQLQGGIYLIIFHVSQD